MPLEFISSARRRTRVWCDVAENASVQGKNKRKNIFSNFATTTTTITLLMDIREGQSSAQCRTVTAKRHFRA